MGKQVVLFGKTMSEERRIEIWVKELGIKARFEQVSEKHAERLAGYGLPSNIVTPSTELKEALQYEEELMKDKRHVQPQSTSQVDTC